MTNATQKPVREVSQFWAWTYIGDGHDKRLCGPCWGRDGFDAAGEARRVWGPGRYLIRAATPTGRIVLKYA